MKRENKDRIKRIKMNSDYAIILGVALRYKDALVEIATRRKIESIGCGTQDNSVEVNIAREALGLPLDIPKYDDPDYEEEEEGENK